MSPCFKAETARRDSARAAQLARGDPGAAADHGLAHLDPARRSASCGATSRSDLYNIQQQLVQLQELTGQSQQRLSELRTQLEARGEQISVHRAGRYARRRRPPPPPPPPTRCTRPRWRSSGGEALRTARQGLREMLRTYPTSDRAGDALYFIGQSFAAENPDSAAAYYDQVVQKYPTSVRAASALYNLGLLAERRKETQKAREAYQRVVQKYPQSDEAALARDRLKALGR